MRGVLSSWLRGSADGGSIAAVLVWPIGLILAPAPGDPLGKTIWSESGFAGSSPCLATSFLIRCWRMLAQMRAADTSSCADLIRAFGLHAASEPCNLCRPILVVEVFRKSEHEPSNR